MSKQPPPAPTASATGPRLIIIQISRTPRHWKITQHLRTTRPPPSQPTKPEPVTRTKLPEGPWQNLAIDLMGLFPSQDNVLVVVDYYSRWYEIALMKSITSPKIINCLDKMFTTHGLPLSITCDNAPQPIISSS